MDAEARSDHVLAGQEHVCTCVHILADRGQMNLEARFAPTGPNLPGRQEDV